MSFRLLDRATAIGASRSIKVQRGTSNHTVDVELESRGATAISAATVVLQGSITNEDSETGVITTSGLAIDTTATRFANSLFYYRIKNTNYSVDADAAGNVFTSAHVVSLTKNGVILIYIDTAGTFITYAPLATQAYDTAEEAHAAADTLKASMVYTHPNQAYVGRILIVAGAGAWTANTDDMTDGSDLATATFLPATSSFYDLATHAFDAGEITAQRAMFHLDATATPFVRVFLSALTGTGYITARYTPTETAG